MPLDSFIYTVDDIPVYCVCRSTNKSDASDRYKNADASTLVDSMLDNVMPEQDIFQKLGSCETLECVSALHPELQKMSTHFNFPHFFLAGWQKCATTSIYRHLRLHPQVWIPKDKEPHYFSSCKRGAPACKVKGGYNATAYLEDTFGIKEVANSKLAYATLDGSVDYAQKGVWLAPLLHRLFPWLKLVFVFREKVGRSMSYKNMLAEKYDKGCKGDLAKCLTYSMVAYNYSDAMIHWFETFSPSQIHLVQFEELVESPEKVLTELKFFLGLDPSLPKKDLRQTNKRPSSSGWPIQKSEYDKLVDHARDDGQKLLDIMEKFKKNTTGWMQRWESLWSRNYDTCQSHAGDQMCSVASM